MRIQDKSFLVTGGASGLGAATARLLIGQGGCIVIADINETAGQNMAAELGDRARFVRTDVTNEVSVQDAVSLSVTTFGGLHGVINAAGIAVAKRTLGKNGPHSLESFVRVIQINLVGTFNVIRLAVNAIVDGEPAEDDERGVIINTASVSAFDGQIGQAAYSASKGGVVGMTLPIARELAKFGVRVMTIAPGIFDTPLLQTLPENIQKALAAGIPFPQRLGDPNEFASLVCHFAENPSLNGETVRLDGAVRLS